MCHIKLCYVKFWCYTKNINSMEVSKMVLSEIEIKSHDDYEYFARYLGVDYDDYVESIGDYEYGEFEVEYESCVK